MNTYKITCTPTAAAANAVGASHSPGSGAIAIDGTKAATTAAPTTGTARVTVTSSGDDSANSVTIVGYITTTAGAQAWSEVLALTNAKTATSVAAWSSVTSITMGAQAAGNVYAGFEGYASNSISTTASQPSGALTINGSLKVTAAVLGAAQLITLVCGGNDTGITYTINGTDADGYTITEDVTGVSGSTATSTKHFKTVTSVTHTGSVATTLSVGCTIDSVSPSFIRRLQPMPSKVSVGCQLDASTATFELQDTYGGLNGAQESVTWIQNATVNGKSASFAYSYGDLMPFATRLRLTAAGSTGSVSANFVIQRAW